MTKPTIIRQAGTLVYDFSRYGLRFGLVTSRGRGRWVIPKGNICKGATWSESAEKETFEELGVKGELIDFEIGRFTYTKADEPEERLYEVAVYPMNAVEILDEWPEMDHRFRDWVSPFEAAQRVEEPDLKQMITMFAADLAAIRFAA